MTTPTGTASRARSAFRTVSIVYTPYLHTVGVGWCDGWRKE